MTEYGMGRRSTASQLASDEVQSMMVQKATELFAVCDVENKGFISKNEMQRLQQELPLEKEQLEAVFDSLDDDKNGYLTLEEFTNGFGSFLGIPSKEEKKENEQEKKEKIYEASREIDHSFDDENFHGMLEEMGVVEVVDDVDGLKTMWQGLRENQPELLPNFEEFLHKMTGELKRTKGDYKSLQTALRNKTLSHDDEMRRLYDEMETQMNAEKQKILNEEKQKERSLKMELEQELKDKDKHFQELTNNHQKMKDMLDRMNSQETETKQENEKLLKDKKSIKRMLEESQRNLEESRLQINELKSQQKKDKLTRVKAALQANEGIAIERESLVKQLDVLREMNKKLRDERDEAEMKRIYCNSGEFDEFAPNLERSLSRQDSKHGSSDPAGSGDAQGDIPRRLQMKRGSVLSDYIPNMPWRPTDAGFEEEIECDDDVIIPTGPFHSGAAYELDDEESHVTQTREQPVGANSTEFNEHKFQNLESMTPERVFKVVFVGDSGVGKSSFIHQFASNTFKPAFQATIGVDFQVKNIRVDGHVVAIQVWDTAGQERFRSITKQYFRKADGVIVMYDVTNESSFKSVRNWMSSVQDGTEETTVVMVVGNKVDLVNDDNPQAVSFKSGQKMAEEYSALFQETSSKTGLNVYDSVEMIAKLLSEKEDQYIEALQLASPLGRKKACCK